LGAETGSHGANIDVGFTPESGPWAESRFGMGVARAHAVIKFTGRRRSCVDANNEHALSRQILQKPAISMRYDVQNLGNPPIALPRPGSVRFSSVGGPVGAMPVPSKVVVDEQYTSA
jgi:hypothetical protein